MTGPTPDFFTVLDMFLTSATDKQVADVFALVKKEHLKRVPIMHHTFYEGCLEIVANIWGFMPPEALMQGRKAHATNARKQLAALLREKSAMSYKTIGELMHRDHSTIMNLVDQHKAHMKNEGWYASFYFDRVLPAFNEWESNYLGNPDLAVFSVSK